MDTFSTKEKSEWIKNKFSHLIYDHHLFHITFSYEALFLCC